jgi:hypothetical protein
MKKCILLFVLVFQLLIAFEHDISLDYFNSPVFVNIDDSAVFQVRVKNVGEQTIYQFVINLQVNEITIESVQINRPLVPTEERTYPFVWIVPNTTDLTALVNAEIVYSMDENSENNSSSSRLLHIFNSNIVEYYFTSYQHTTSWYPFNFSFRNNLAESIYYNSELNFSGNVHACTYLYSFQDYVYNENVKIFMGITSQTHLENGWINAGSLTEVFNDNYTFSQAAHFATFRFNAPFTYTNGNLVILTNRVYDSDLYSSDNSFYEFPNSTFINRTRALNSANQLNPNSPPNQGYLFNRMPSIIFHYEESDLGSLSGTVIDGDGDLLYGAKITMDGERETYSNSEGYFKMSRIEQGNHAFDFSKIGFESISQTIAIQSNESFQAQMIPIQTVSVYGNVVFADQPENALTNYPLHLNGYENYVTLTDEIGNFSFQGVFVNRDYTLKILFDGYEEIDQTIEVGIVELDVGTIYLQEILYPAENVMAVDDENQSVAAITWDYLPERSFESFSLYRLFEYDLDFPDFWELISDSILETEFTDESWQNVPNGNYFYAIIVNYSNEHESEPAFSNVLNKQSIHSEIDVIHERTDLRLYPNPFNPHLNISYDKKSSEPVHLSIYNSKGQNILTVADFSGEMTWNAEKEASGIYFVQIINSEKKLVRKAILMK